MSPPARYVAGVIALVVSLCTLIVALPSAWSTLDLPIPAMREWTLSQLGPLHGEQKSQRAILYEIRRGQLEREIFDLERRPSRNDSDEWRLRQLREDLRRLDERERK